jgi:hypothetical protein
MSNIRSRRSTMLWADAPARILFPNPMATLTSRFFVASLAPSP